MPPTFSPQETKLVQALSQRPAVLKAYTKIKKDALQTASTEENSSLIEWASGMIGRVAKSFPGDLQKDVVMHRVLLAKEFLKLAEKSCANDEAEIIDGVGVTEESTKDYDDNNEIMKSQEIEDELQKLEQFLQTTNTDLYYSLQQQKQTNNKLTNNNLLQI